MKVMKILILDSKKNNISTYRMLANFLEENDYHVDLLFSPKEAIERIENKNADYDLLMVDYNISNMKCTEVLQRVKNVNDRLTLVAMADEIVPKEEIKNIRRFSDYFISKPIDVNLLKKFMAL